MLIQSKLKREGGTLIGIGDEEYHFKDDGNGNHVCDVKNESHVKKLLSITEGFHKFGEKPVKQDLLDEPVDDNENKLPENPEDWTNKQANDWAKAHKLNPNNKPNLIDFAVSKGIAEIDENLNPAAIIRLIAKAMMA